jgi:hypothetical protein
MDMVLYKYVMIPVILGNPYEPRKGVDPKHVTSRLETP